MLPSAGELTKNVPDEVRELVAELAENVIFMHGKLIETRKGLDRQQVVVPYDNGGGQKGIRENPAFKAYNALLTSYRKSLLDLVSLLTEYGGFVRKDEDSPLARILAEAEELINAK